MNNHYYIVPLHFVFGAVAICISIALAILKLTNCIVYSWWVVAYPVFGFMLLSCLALCVALCVSSFKSATKKRAHHITLEIF